MDRAQGGHLNGEIKRRTGSACVQKGKWVREWLFVVYMLCSCVRVLPFGVMVFLKDISRKLANQVLLADNHIIGII